MCKMDSQWEAAIYYWEHSLAVCDDLEGLDGVVSGKETQEEGNICIIMADSCCCIAETNTTL